MSVEILKQNGYKFLWIDGYLWMWDIPVERKIQQRIADEAYGDVLVAGYGLGIVQWYLLNNPRVNLVVTMEKNPDVISACLNEYGELYGTVNEGDFYKTIALTKFDCIVGDIWDDIVPEQLPNYIKFKNQAKKLVKPDGKLLAWGKDYFEYLLDKENNVECDHLVKNTDCTCVHCGVCRMDCEKDEKGFHKND